jgi:hypothetical protein
MYRLGIYVEVLKGAGIESRSGQPDLRFELGSSRIKFRRLTFCVAWHVEDLTVVSRYLFIYEKWVYPVT